MTVKPTYYDPTTDAFKAAFDAGYAAAKMDPENGPFVSCTGIMALEERVRDLLQEITDHVSTCDACQRAGRELGIVSVSFDTGG